MTSPALEFMLSINAIDAIRSLQRVEHGFSGLSQAAGGVNRTIGTISAALAGIGVGVSVADSVQKFIEFDDAIRSVGSKSGATKEELQKLAEAARDMGSKTRYSATEAANAMQALAAAGQSTEQIIANLPAVLNLAATEGMNLGDAANILTNIMAQFSIKTKESQKVVDLLASASSASKASVKSLGDALSYAGTIAKAAGTDIESTITILAALSQNGYEGERAGTALRGAMNNIINPTKDAQEVLDQYGIKVKDASGKIREFDDILKDLASSKMDVQAILQLFGQEPGPGMASLMQMLRTQRGEWNQLEQAVNSYQGSAKRMSDDMEGGIGGSLRNYQSAIEELQLTFAQQLAPNLTEGIRALSSVMNDPDFRQGISTIGSALASLITFIGQHGEAVAAVAGIYLGWNLAIRPVITVLGSLSTAAGAAGAGGLTTLWHVLTGILSMPLSQLPTLFIGIASAASTLPTILASITTTAGAFIATNVVLVAGLAALAVAFAGLEYLDSTVSEEVAAQDATYEKLNRLNLLLGEMRRQGVQMDQDVIKPIRALRNAVQDGSMSFDEAYEKAKSYSDAMINAAESSKKVGGAAKQAKMDVQAFVGEPTQKKVQVSADTSAAQATEQAFVGDPEQKNINLNVDTANATANVGAVRDDINSLNQIQTQSNHGVADNVNEASSRINSLNGQDTYSTHHITVVEHRNSGGLIGLANGGRVPGWGVNRDTVPAMLTRGEFVIKRDRASMFSGLLQMINYGSLSTIRKVLEQGVQGFNTGGMVLPTIPSLSKSLAGAAEKNNTKTIRIELVSPTGEKINLSGSSLDAEGLIKMLHRQKLTRLR